MKVGNLGQVVSLFVVNNDLKVLDDEISYGICSNSFPITHEITNIDKSDIFRFFNVINGVEWKN